MKTRLLPDEVWLQIKPIFAAEWPKEAIIAIWPDRWEQIENASPTPALNFTIPSDVHSRLLLDPPQLLLHSHPNGDPTPSDEDTTGQLATGWNWGIVAVHACPPDYIAVVDYPECWGDGVEIPPLEGRTYLWGIRDCWTLARDYMRLQGQAVPNCPRAQTPSRYPVGHWGHNQFAYWPPKLGLRPIDRDKRLPGDLALMHLQSTAINHCGIWLGESRVLHHVAKRNSGIWNIGEEEKFIERMNVTFHRWQQPKSR